MSGRGLAYWTDGKQERIVYVTPGYQLVALDARTGQRLLTFGKAGIVDLKLENDQEVDLETGDIGLHAASFTNAVSVGLVNDAARSDMNFGRGRAASGRGGGAAGGGAGAGGGGGGEGGGTAITVRGLPLIKPRYGRISAIDLNKGEMLRQVAHGDTPDNVRNHPALKGVNVPRTGRTNGRIGTLVTRSLVIAGEPGFTTTSQGRGALLRAYDKATGADAGAAYMPAPRTGSPMTYMRHGKQYIVVAVSGPGYSAELLAYSLRSSK